MTLASSIAELLSDEHAPEFSRQELVTMVLALEEFRDETGPGEPELAERVNGVLRGPGETFRLAATDG